MEFLSGIGELVVWAIFWFVAFTATEAIKEHFQRKKRPKPL